MPFDTGSDALDVVAAIFNNTPPTVADGKTSPLQLDSRGNLKATIVATNGTSGVTQTPADAFANVVSLAVLAQAMLYRGDGTWDRGRGQTVVKRINNIAVVAGTPATIWTPAAGKKFRLMGYALTISVGAGIFLTDGSGGTTFLQHSGAANDQRATPPGFGNGYFSAVANNVLQLDVGANGTVNGYVFGTEE